MVSSRSVVDLGGRPQAIGPQGKRVVAQLEIHDLIVAAARSEDESVAAGEVMIDDRAPW